MAEGSSSKKHKLDLDDRPAKRRRFDTSPSTSSSSSTTTCTVTQTQVIEKEPPKTYTIVLKKKPEVIEKLENEESSSAISSSFKAMKTFIKSVVPESLLTKEDKPDEKLSENPEKLKEFQEMIRKRAQKMKDEANKHIDQAQEKIIKELPEMSVAEAKEVVSWWDSVMGFFTEVWKAFVDAVWTVIEKVKEGMKFIAQKFKEAVQTLVDALNSLFS